jgi:pimeloyl-ACP methyl ester carboxylesterase
VPRIAAAWAELMARLGYRRYGAQGGDWGTSVSTLLGQHDREHVAGIHLTPPLAPPDPATFDDLTEAERATLASLEHAAEWDSGYSREHGTRPQTIGYGLVDSPAALCAWIIEKFWAWTDHGGHLENVLTRDELLDNLMLYWLPGTGASAARLYWESIRQVNQWISGPVGDTVDVPTGCSVFPGELQRPSRRWAARRFTDIRYWNEPPRGGHFAAFEQPELFVDEVRSFFRLVRLPRRRPRPRRQVPQPGRPSRPAAQLVPHHTGITQASADFCMHAAYYFVVTQFVVNRVQSWWNWITAQSDIIASAKQLLGLLIAHRFLQVIASQSKIFCHIGQTCLRTYMPPTWKVSLLGRSPDPCTVSHESPRKWNIKGICVHRTTTSLEEFT